MQFILCIVHGYDAISSLNCRNMFAYFMSMILWARLWAVYSLYFSFAFDSYENIICVKGNKLCGSVLL
jgi:hypothetical protein